MVVTDITRMEGERVCVGGYLEDGAAVRPVAGRTGPDERWLHSARGAPVIPFSLVELHVGRAPKRLSAPHTEDRTIPAKGHRVLRILSEQERQALLGQSLSPSVRAIFDAEIHADANGQWGRYVRAGEGLRSLGTVRATSIRTVRYQHYPERGRWDYRLRFVDGSGEEFQLAVVDLDFRHRLDALRDGGLPLERIGPTVLTALRQQAVYLRIGLARGWAKHPDRCYLQITGVYGFQAGEGDGVMGSEGSKHDPPQLPSTPLSPHHP
jgi:hypothetical protein